MTLPIKVIKNFIVFPVRDPERVRSIFPEVKIGEVNGSYICAVPHTVDAVRFFQNNGHPLPSPIMTTYPWPGRFKPYAHQMATSEFLTLNRRCFCLSGMGTGKTKSALWATDFLMKQGEVDKCLIISPLSTLDRVWAQEIFETLPGRRYAIIHARGKGARERRQRLLADKKIDFYVTNHDGIEIICDLLKERPDINHVIVDEIAVARNARTRRCRILFEILNRQGIDRSAWGLTGTPTPNAPTDCHGQLRLIVPEKHRSSFKALQNELMYQISQFKWVPRPRASERVFELMQPAIRYALEDCVDLPPTIYQTRTAELSPQQEKHYNELRRQAFTEIEGTAVSAVNAGVLLSKLCQASCLAAGTEVLTNTGWKPIEEILFSDRVWDGEEYVEHGGVACNGLREVVYWDGLLLTDDHKMLTTYGWTTAKEIEDGNASEGLEWPKVQLPDGTSESRVDQSRPVKGIAASLVGMPLRLRERSRPDREQPQSDPKTQRGALRVPEQVQSDTWDDQHTALQYLEQDEGAVPEPHRQGLQKLRSERDFCLPAVGELFSGFLGRCGAWVFPRADTRTNRQQRPVQSGKLPLGNVATARQQQEEQQNNFNPRGRSHGFAGGSIVWAPPSNATCSDLSVQVEYRESPVCAETAQRPLEALVYDILNCGPRSRFVVRTADGRIRIAHNCGVLYGPGGEVVELDFGPRLSVLRDTIEECNEKVIVFVPFTGALNALHDELKRDWSVAIVDGSVSSTKRNQIFKDFQNSENPHILLANAGAMAHGLTLTAASTIIWYGPTCSNEIFTQANARIVRPGQTKTTNIVMLQGTKAEEGIYTALREKGKLQDVLLGLVKGG